MVNSPRPKDRDNPSPSSNSPNSNGSSTNSNAVTPATQILTPPPTPKPISRSETNPYPTTFVQADSTTFKHVVQLLTGSSETAKHASNSKPADPHPIKNCSIPPIKTAQKKQSFKLYERRNSLKNGLMINPSIHSFAHHNNSGFSPRGKLEILSPSILDFPSLALSPVTPLREDQLNNKKCGNSSEEDKAIAEKGFYLHPSPLSTPRDGVEPQLLPLFPVTSPRV